MDTASNSEAKRWLDFIVGRLFYFMHAVEADNFDAVRYRGQDPNAYPFDRHAAYFSLLLSNADKFFSARQLLVDDPSRDLFDRLVLFRILGHHHIRLPFNTAEHRRHPVEADGWRVMETEDEGHFGPLAIFLIPGPDQIRVKCWRENVAATWLDRAYFLARDGVSVGPRIADVVIDAGACFGDTALAFAAAVGETGKVHAFDPMPRHCSVIAQNVEMNRRLGKRIEVHQVGLSDRVREGPGPSIDGINPGATTADESIPTTTLDALATSGRISDVDFIKMDIEGSEMAALRGAETVLRRCRPRLAISLYHRPTDFFEIPLWLHALGVGYRFYLDHYSIHHEETVLFAEAA